MRVRYTPTLDDYWAIHRIVLRRNRRLWFVITFVPLLSMVLLFALWRLSGSSPIASNLPSPWWLLLFIPGWFLFWRQIAYSVVRRTWREAPQLRATREIEIEDSGVRVTTAHSSHSSDWTIFTEATMTERFVILGTAQRTYQYFPNAAVPDLPALRELLRRKVPAVR